MTPLARLLTGALSLLGFLLLAGLTTGNALLGAIARASWRL